MKKNCVLFSLILIFTFASVSQVFAKDSDKSDFYFDIGLSFNSANFTGSESSPDWHVFAPGACVSLDKKLIPLLGIMANIDAFYDVKNEALAFDLNALIGPHFNFKKDTVNFLFGIGPDLYINTSAYAQGVSVGAAGQFKFQYMFKNRLGFYLSTLVSYDFLNINGSGFNINNMFRIVPSIGFTFK